MYLPFCAKIVAELTNVLKGLWFKQVSSVLIFGNKPKSRHLAGNLAYSNRTKYYALRFFMLRELVGDENIGVYYVSNNN